MHRCCHWVLSMLHSPRVSRNSELIRLHEKESLCYHAHSNVFVQWSVTGIFSHYVVMLRVMSQNVDEPVCVLTTFTCTFVSNDFRVSPSFSWEQNKLCWCDWRTTRLKCYICNHVTIVRNCDGHTSGLLTERCDQQASQHVDYAAPESIFDGIRATPGEQIKSLSTTAV